MTKRLTLLETRIDQHVRACDALKTASCRLQAMPGIGPILNASLVVNLPELGHIDRREIDSMSGLAPHARDSGLFKGKRRTWGQGQCAPHALSGGSQSQPIRPNPARLSETPARRRHFLLRELPPFFMQS
ncbi:MAG: transposase [Rhodobacteraceae bacterium]|nr:transposase [Paracoccaceae bacterium]